MKTIESVKKEFIDRYNFIIENADIILAMYPSKVIGRQIEYMIPEEDLCMMESFLLSDVPCNESTLAKKMPEARDKKLETVILSLNELMEQVKKINRYERNPRKFFQIVRDYILGEEESLERTKKLTALDEYFRFNRYNNTSCIYRSGANEEDYDFGDINQDKPSKNHDVLHIESEFINTIANKNNHRIDNNSLFSEEEKQEVYLLHHKDVLPWNFSVSCKSNSNLSSVPCNEEFYLTEGNIFTYDGSEFYYMCPKCGNIIKLDNDLLPTKLKTAVINRASEDLTLYEAWINYSKLFSRDIKIRKKGRTFLIGHYN